MKKTIAGLLGLAAAVAAALPVSAQQPRSPFEQFRQLKLDGHFVRWPSPGQGSLLLTYKVLDKFQTFDGARNCRRMTGIDDVERDSKIPRATFMAELKTAFEMWEAAANIRFREASDGEAANILIGTQADPEGWAFADVFYDSGAAEKVKPISLALVCLNPRKAWKVGFNGDLRVYDLRYTLAHEIGHAIGLDHPNSPGQIMGYRYEESFRQLQVGDISGAAALYGPPHHIEVARPRQDGAEQSAREAGGKNWTSRALHPKAN